MILVMSPIMIIPVSLIQTSSAEDLCGAASWACYEQNYANMGGVCDDDWKRCCQRYSCSHEETVDQCTRVFSQYDSQVKISK